VQQRCRLFNWCQRCVGGGNVCGGCGFGRGSDVTGLLVAGMLAAAAALAVEEAPTVCDGDGLSSGVVGGSVCVGGVGGGGDSIYEFAFCGVVEG
jgi:hypothetical protein